MPMLHHHLIAVSLGLIPLLTLADEVGSYCELVATQGKAQSALLNAPDAFASVGDPAAQNRSVVAGVRGSLSRWRQGHLVTELAQAQCIAYRSKKRLGQRLAGIEQEAEQRGLVALGPALKSAIALAESNVGRERQMLERRQSTLLDVRAALDLQDRLRERQARAAQRLGYLSARPPVEDGAVQPDVEQAIADQARVTQLTSRLQAETGWDVNLSVGVRRALSDGTQSTFASVALSRNFDLGSARQAALDTNDLASRWLASQEDGPLQQLLRARDAIAGAHAAGEIIRTGLQDRRRALRETLEALDGSDTATAARTARSLRAEILATDAELADHAARQTYLQDWLSANATAP